MAKSGFAAGRPVLEQVGGDRLRRRSRAARPARERGVVRLGRKPIRGERGRRRATTATNGADRRRVRTVRRSASRRTSRNGRKTPSSPHFAEIGRFDNPDSPRSARRVADDGNADRSRRCRLRLEVNGTLARQESGVLVRLDFNAQLPLARPGAFAFGSNVTFRKSGALPFQSPGRGRPSVLVTRTVLSTPRSARKVARLIRSWSVPSPTRTLPRIVPLSRYRAPPVGRACGRPPCG